MRTLTLLFLLCLPMLAGDTTRLEIHVLNERGKPVDRASVIVKFVSGRNFNTLAIRGTKRSWELKTSQEGIAKIPPIPKGKILIQVNAKYYQTYGQTFDIDDDERLVEIKLNPPQKQYSAHDK